jgi:hypothetical protein
MGTKNIKLKDRIGKKFNRLLVLEAKLVGPAKYLALVRCDCGVEKVLDGNSVFRGHSKSCGCLGKESLLKRNHRHGMRHTRTYRIWLNMKNRCLNPRTACYIDYGGRGISICSEWSNSFMEFYKDMGECPPGFSIDRINNDGNYDKQNCRWADKYTQGNNTRRNTFLTVDGITKTVSQWSRHSGLTVNTILSRIRYGWTHKDCVQK